MFLGITCDRARNEARLYITRDECDACSHLPDRPCPYNGKMLAKLWGDDDHEPKNDTFSPTRVSGCKRAMYYAATGTDEILDPDTRWNMVRGTMCHSFFEHTPTASGVEMDIMEERMSIDLPTKYGVKTFTGKPDLIEVLYLSEHMVEVKLTDWKSCKDIPHDMVQAKPEHELQINMYAYLIIKCLPALLGKPNIKVWIEGLEIVYFTMGKVRRFASCANIQSKGKMLRPYSSRQYEYIDLVPLKEMSQFDVKACIIDRIEKAIEAQEEPAPRLEGEDARICPYCTYFVACKGGNEWNS